VGDRDGEGDLTATGADMLVVCGLVAANDTGFCCCCCCWGEDVRMAGLGALVNVGEGTEGTRGGGATGSAAKDTCLAACAGVGLLLLLERPPLLAPVMSLPLLPLAASCPTTGDRLVVGAGEAAFGELAAAAAGAAGVVAGEAAAAAAAAGVAAAVVAATPAGAGVEAAESGNADPAGATRGVSGADDVTMTGGAITPSGVSMGVSDALA
jgi:hypothetical protein